MKFTAVLMAAFAMLVMPAVLAQQTFPFSIRIQADNNPEEISWTFRVPGGRVFSGGVPGAAGNLPSGTYLFTINDAGNNGICCNNGNGQYSLRLGDVDFVTRDGQFGNQEQIQFRINRNGVARRIRIATTEPEDTPAPTQNPQPTAPPAGGNPAARFNIELVPAAGFDPNSRRETVDALEAAARRWESIIVGDLPDVQLRNGDVIDDLRITYDFSPIDGPGSTIGQAGPRSLRRGSQLPTTGVMTFDSADIGRQSPAQQEALFLHEMGHILGVGTLWDNLGLSRCRAQNNPLYSPNNANSNARVAFRNSPGRNNNVELLIEQDGGGGTACGHFDEVQLQSEVMTGFLTVNRRTGISEVSSITIGTLADMGYQVDTSRADPFTIPQTRLNSLEEDEEAMDLRGDIMDTEYEYVDTMDDMRMFASMPSLESLEVKESSGKLNVPAFAAGASAVIALAVVGAVAVRRRQKMAVAENQVQLV